MTTTDRAMLGCSAQRARSGAAYNAGGAALVPIGMVVFAALSGVLLGVGGGYAALAIIALSVACAALVLPLPTFFYLLVAIAFLVVGQVQYFGGIDKAFWIPYLLALLVYLRLALIGLASRGRGQHAPLRGWTLLSAWMFGLFLLAAASSSLINGVDPLQWLVAGKEYFMLWSVGLAFLVGALTARHVEVLIRWIPLFLAVQVVAVVYQRFVVAARRAGDSPWDAVVGLFGGDPMAGGASGTMAIFSLICVALFAEAWKAGRVSGTRAVSVCIFALAACALAEVKLVIVMLPIILGLVFGSELLARPLAAALGIVGGVAVALGLALLYQQQFASERTKEGASIQAYVAAALDRNLDTSTALSRYGDIGRVAILGFWWREQRLSEPVGSLIGLGVGSSRVGGMFEGELVRKYQFRVGRTSLVVLLWEVGLIGTVAFVSGLLSAAIAARRMAQRTEFAALGWLLRAVAISLVLVLVSLPYGADFIEVSQLQLLTMLMLGALVAAARQRAPTPART
jgi:hypothetical protein